VELAQPGNYITLRNAKIDMYRGSMRLAVDQWGKVEASEVTGFQPKVRAAQPQPSSPSYACIQVVPAAVTPVLPAACQQQLQQSSCAATTASKHTHQTACCFTSSALQCLTQCHLAPLQKDNNLSLIEYELVTVPAEQAAALVAAQ
jgi:hypothetical protein